MATNTVLQLTNHTNSYHDLLDIFDASRRYHIGNPKHPWIFRLSSTFAIRHDDAPNIGSVYYGYANQIRNPKPTVVPVFMLTRAGVSNGQLVYSSNYCRKNIPLHQLRQFEADLFTAMEHMQEFIYRCIENRQFCPCCFSTYRRTSGIVHHTAHCLRQYFI